MTRIFISHSHADQEIASLLVDFLLAALELRPEEIRCTSVPGHQLPFGTSIGEQLKKDLNNTNGLIALITQDSLRSTWVLFELGSSWANDKLVVPILGPGLTYGDFPGPLRQYPGVKIEQENVAYRFTDVINQLASELGIKQETNARRDAKLNEFITRFRNRKARFSNFDISQQKQIEELIRKIEESERSHKQELEAIEKQYLQGQRELERSQAKITQLEDKLKQERLRKQELEALETQYQQEQQELERSQSQIQRLEEQLKQEQTQKKELKALKIQYIQAQQKLERSQAKITQLEDKLKQERSRVKITQLENQLGKERSHSNQVQEIKSTSVSIDRRNFLKCAGLGGLCLVIAVVSRELLKAPQSISVAEPKIINSNPSSFNLLEEVLVNVEFETVSVNKKGEVVKRYHKQISVFKEDLGNDVMLEMVSIPGGKFMMGSPSDEKGRYTYESPQHEGTVQPFFMGKYSITQAQYQEVMNNNPSYFNGDNRPVERVSWEDADKFCQELSKQTGKEYRLPTEAEWEYAARGGKTTPFHFGETITSNLANYKGTSTFANEPKGEYRKETVLVGSFPPNDFGLYDMHGNVWEWCQDDWHINQGKRTRFLIFEEEKKRDSQINIRMLKIS